MFLNDITQRTHAQVIFQELYKNYDVALLHQLCSESNYSYFIHEESEDRRLAACLGMLS